MLCFFIGGDNMTCIKEMSKELNTKIVNAMERIEQLVRMTDGKCYLSFSGGKDSTVVLALIKMCQDIYTIRPYSIPAVYSETGLELGATSRFVRFIKDTYYPNIHMIRPIYSFHYIIENFGKPIKSKMRSEYLFRYHSKNSQSALSNLLDPKQKKIYIANKDLHMLHPDFKIQCTNKCCLYLKKKPFDTYSKNNDILGYLTGLRMAEGGARTMNALNRVKNGGRLCMTASKGKTVIMPIIDWTNQDIEDFISYYNVPLSEAYTEYHCKRTGCFLCPYSLNLKEDLSVLYYNEPNRYTAAIHWLKDVYIAQNVILPFDFTYERERIKKWADEYDKMRYDMMLKYRPNIASKYSNCQLSLDL